MKRILAALLTFSLSVSAFAAPQTFKIDPAHSSVGFGVRHFFSKVPGSFAKFDGTIVFDAEAPEQSVAEATIQVSSVNTNDAKRDGHLQNEDFFQADKFPTMSFKSKSWKKTGDDTFDITGDLTIKDVTQEVTLNAKLLGVGPGMRGATLSGWEATTKLDRTKFGINYGLPAVGKEVDVTLNIEAVLQK